MAHEVNQTCESTTTQLRELLRHKIGSDRFDLWISASTDWELNSQSLTLRFPTEFERQLCRRTLGDELSQLVSSHFSDKNCEIRFEVQKAERCVESTQLMSVESGFRKPMPGSRENDSPRSNHDSEAPNVSRGHYRDSSASGIRRSSQLPTDAFQQLLVGDSNEMAVAAVKMAAMEPGRLSPVVLHGPPGCGKSMMLSAISQHLRSSLRMRRVVNLTSEQFTNDFTEGLRGGGLPMFRRKYRDVEALLLDDLQFFAGKRSTLAEVRHTIDNLVRAGKQVVVTLDRPLNDLAALGDELVGRLRGGLVAPVFPLDLSIRIRLFRRLIDLAGVSLEEGVLEKLADRISGDGRLLKGVVHRLTAVSSFSKSKLNWDRSWSAVFDLIQSNQPVVRLVDIERAVCGMFGLQQDVLQSESKTRAISQPRMLAMFLARKYTPAAYKEIGEYFGRRRHSTVISAEKTVQNWLKENTQLDGPCQLSIREALRQVASQLQVG